MKRMWKLIVAAFLLAALAACGGSESGSGEQGAGTRTPQNEEPMIMTTRTGTFFVINEIGLSPNGYVALTNFTDVTTSLGGLVLCQEDDCFELPSIEVGPHETVRVGVGKDGGVDNVVATWQDAELRPTDGEIALTTSDDVDNPDAMLFYFQWGSHPHELTDVAIKAGLWLEGAYGPTSENATRLYRVERSGLWLFEE